MGHPAVVVTQKLSFNASWPMRGATEVVVI
jgi:hypothetical protein